MRNQRRGAFFSTERIDVGLTEENERYVIEGGYRAPKWLLRARAERRSRRTPLPGAESDEQNGGWVFDIRWAPRLSSDLELLFDFLGDTETSASLPTRPLRRGGLGFLYQRGNHLQTSAHASRARVRTEGGLEYDLSRTEAGVVYFRNGFQLGSAFAYSQSNGRLAASEGFGAVDLAAHVGRYVVARASSANRWEPGVKRFEQDTRGGVTVFARQHHFLRGGEVGSRVLELTRNAYHLGYNERRIYDIEGLRALRERLSLSSRRTELAADLDELYRAEVRERNVPQAGFEIVRRTNDLVGVSSWTYRVFATMPWRVNWPFVRNEDSVNFIRVEYNREELDFQTDFSSFQRELVVDVALNREITARFRWIDPARTPEDIALFRTRPNRIELEFDYAFGR